jgi:hypothetical protein
MLAEMGIAWPSLASSRDRTQNWIAVPRDTPTETEAKLLDNMLTAVRLACGARSVVVPLTPPIQDAPAIHTHLRRFESARSVFLLLGEDVARELMGDAAAVGTVAQLWHSSIAVVTHPLAAVKSQPRLKARVWEHLCAAISAAQSRDPA